MPHSVYNSVIDVIDICFLTHVAKKCKETIIFKVIVQYDNNYINCVENIEKSKGHTCDRLKFLFKIEYISI